MNKTLRPAPVRKSVTVHAPQSRAFAVFTDGLGRWWPASHSIGASPIRSAVIEPHRGGRWYEISEDGSICPWGEVLEWEPPNRVLLAWRIGLDWQYDPTLLTEVEVLFIPMGDRQTRVDLEHRLIENMGDAAEQAREIFGSEAGWPGLLAAYCAEAEREAA